MSWPPEMGLVLLSPTAVAFLPVVVLQLVVLGYLLRVKGKSQQTWLFIGWMAGLMLTMACEFATATIYAPIGGYISWIGKIAFGMLTLTLELQFVYRFPRLIYPREARSVLIASGVVLAWMLALAIVGAAFTATQVGYIFGQFGYRLFRLDDGQLFASAQFFALLSPAVQLWVCLVLVRHAVHLSALGIRNAEAEEEAGGRAARLRRVAKAVWRPEKEARAPRVLMLPVLAAAIVALIATREPEGVLPLIGLVIAQLFLVSAFFVVYTDYSPAPTGILARKVGLFLVIMLTIMAVVGPLIVSRSAELYEQTEQGDLESIKTLVSTDRLSQVPEEVLYIAARPAAGGLFSQAYSLVLSRVNNLSADTLAREDRSLQTGLEQGKLSDRVAVLSENPWLTFDQLSGKLDSLAIPEAISSYRGTFAAPDQHYIRHTLVSQDGKTLYEVGFDYLSYRLVLHRQAALLALMTLGYTLLILLGLPLVLRINVLGQVRNLLEAMTRIKSPDLTGVPVEAMGETALASVAYDTTLPPVWVRSPEPQPVEPGPKNGRDYPGDMGERITALKVLNAQLEDQIARYVRDQEGLQRSRDVFEKRLEERTAELVQAKEQLSLATAERGRAEAEVQAFVKLEQMLAEQTRRLKSLYQISAVGSQALNLQVLLRESLSLSIAAIQSDAGAIWLLEENQDGPEPKLKLAVHQGVAPDNMSWIAPMLSDRDGSSWLTEHHRPVMIPDVSTDARTAPVGRQVGAGTLLVAPLLADGNVLGILGLGRRAGPLYSVDDIEILASIADHVGLGVGSNRLRQQAIVLEERQRIARDLHDSITQSLYGLVTLIEAGQVQMENGAPRSIDLTLSLVGDTTRQILKEMRLFIFQLNPPLLEQEGLVGALHQRLESVEGHANIQARLVCDEIIRLPLPVEMALHHIAQEALNNTLRHARAKSVFIHLGRQDGHVVMEVVDDGCGFNPQAISRAGMGLRNMHKRAEEIGGTLDISSRPGEGTRIKIMIENGE